MFRKILFILLIFIINALIWAENFVIRFENPSPQVLKKFTQSNYDIASFKPGEYLDIVVNEQIYQTILELGYNVRITQTERQLRANLREPSELDGYQTYAEMLSALQLIEQNNPTIAKLYNIGESRGKQYSDAGIIAYDDYYHDVWALKVSDNVESVEDEPEVYFVAEHHAREPISLEVVMNLIDHILTNYGTDPTITYNVDNTEIWFVPLINPNGHKIVTDETNIWWRKNLCDNNGNGNINATGYYANDGVDLNRNYGFEWGGASNNWTSETYQGTEPFSEPETQAVRNFLAEHHFVAGISYHSYGELILYPYGYAETAVAPDQIALNELAVAMSLVLPGQYGGNYTPQPSWALYPCTGTTDDYVYGMQGVFGFTIELATEFIPPASQVAQICDDNIDAALLLLNRINYSSLRGHITDAVSGEPVQAEIFIEGIDNTGAFRHPYTSNEQFGSYYRILSDGSYQVSFHAFGYEPQTFENISITNDNFTVLDVNMQPSVADITISGIVSDAATGLPVAGAVVCIEGYDIPAATTNTNGEYEIADVYAYSYDFLVYKNNYASHSENIYVDDSNNEIDFSLAVLDDGTFENALLGLCWEFGGNADWYIDNTNANNGSFSIRSGNIGHNQISEIMVSLFVETDSEISFACQVSSEPDYDYLKFFLDDMLVDQWSGITGWQTVSYAVSPGNHSFRWQYYKDQAVSNGSDCTWLDDIVLPISNLIVSPVILEFLTMQSCEDGLEFYILNSGSNDIMIDSITTYGTEIPWFIEDFSMTFPHPLPAGEQLDFLVKIDLTDNLQRDVISEDLLIETNSGVKTITILFDTDLTVDSNDLPNSLETEFYGNYPNPFNPSTTFKFHLAKESLVNLKVYNIRGQLIKRIVSANLPAGLHTVVWNGRDENEKNVSSGIYFSTMEAENDLGDYTSVKKVILLK
jgi:hypothetical protein